MIMYHEVRAVRRYRIEALGAAKSCHTSKAVDRDDNHDHCANPFAERSTLTKCPPCKAGT